MRKYRDDLEGILADMRQEMSQIMVMGAMPGPGEERFLACLVQAIPHIEQAVAALEADGNPV